MTNAYESKLMDTLELTLYIILPETMLKPCSNSKQQANTKIEMFWQNLVEGV